ncbi:MAG: ATP--guanido phosphotransferase [Candidatus Coproplasma sp.]
MEDLTLGTVISSRIRLARNINGYPFPAKLKSDGQAKEIIRSVSSAINKVDEFALKYMDGISEDEALNLVENRLISPALLKNPTRSAVLINEKGDISIMINEEDHLREQCIRGGMSIRQAYADLSEKDSLIARSLPFAYDEQLGYLTACPSNLGTGLRASVMLFLPALSLGGLLPDVVKSARRLGLTVRGAYGEGSGADGYTYQLSNEVTLGVTEENVLTLVEQVVSRVVELEASERERLKKGDDGLALKDKCLRAYGTLTNCALMSHGEFDKLCADLKLAVCLGYVKINDISAIDELMLKMKPSNLNVLAGRTLSAKERDEYRATYASNRIKSLCVKHG